MRVDCKQCGAEHDIGTTTGTSTCVCGATLEVGPSSTGSLSEDLAALPAPARPSPLAGAKDLPAPARPSPLAEVPDLPAPAMPSPLAGAEDLPAPARSAAPPPIPSPPPIPGGARGNTASAMDDNLLAPLGGGGSLNPLDSDLPAPVGNSDALPAPRGFFDDNALAPAGAAPSAGAGAGDSLPAPKGFFDDNALAPAGAAPSAGAGAGAGDSLPAPKGFFDDNALAPAGAAPSAGAGDSLPAPKGFFDDDALAPTGPSRAATPAPSSAGGFFDDVGTAAPDLLGGGGGGEALDFGDVELGGGGAAPLELDSPVASGTSPSAPAQPFGLDGLDLASPGGGAGNMEPLALDLDGGAPAAGGAPGGDSSFDGLDLPEPAASPPDGGASDFLSFSEPSQPAPPPREPTPRTKSSTRTPFGQYSEEEPALQLDTTGSPDAAPPLQRRARATAMANQAARDAKKAKTRKTLVMAVAGVVLLGGLSVGGFYGYSQWAEQGDIEEAVSTHVVNAKKHLHSGEPGHWSKAAALADRALQKDPKSPDALGIAAEARFAGYLDEGTKLGSRRSQGAKLIETIRQNAIKGPHVTKALALQSLLERRSADGIKRLKELLKKNPKDGDAHLYLGWAYASSHLHADAAKAFENAIKQNPNRVAALWGLGSALLDAGKTEEAREALLKVVKVSREQHERDHLGAMVGLAQLAHVDRFGDRENRYLEILERPELDQADPRMVSLAWSLAGDEALKAGRIEEAQRRYSEALKLNAENLAAFVGEGRAAMRVGNLELARERFGRVVSLDEGHITATLGLVEVETSAGEYSKALQLLDSVLKRDPPITAKNVIARCHVLRGAIFETDPEQTAAAEVEYRRAVQLADKSDISPRIALARLYTNIGRSEDARRELDPIREAANNDAATAVTLGIAFLESGDPAEAEHALKKALELRPGDVEASFQLGLAILSQGRNDEAVEQLSQTYRANEGREDIGLQLASVYEKLGTPQKAGKIYEELLLARAPSINTRARAGRFYARYGDVQRAISLGELILQEQPMHPAGLFLAGERLYQDGKFQEARERYQDAVRLAPEPQYLNSLGLACEQLQIFSDAVTHYEDALTRDPNYVAPLIGLGRVQVARGLYDKALEPLVRARELAPKNAMVRYHLGLAYRALREHKKAAEELAVATQEAPPRDGSLPPPTTLGPLFAHGKFLLGETYFDLEKARDAVDAYAASIEFAEKEEAWLNTAYYQLGFAARTIKDKSRALEAWETFLTRQKGDSPQRQAVQRAVLRLKAR